MAMPKSPVPTAREDAVPSSDNEVSAFLAKLRQESLVRTDSNRGRLVFAMDATMSREPSWDRALQMQAAMFHETARIGGIDVQLVYFRGFDECKASKWVSDADALARLMAGIGCRGGHTQIGRVLSHIKRETAKTKIDVAVFAGDAMEESIDDLCRIAGELGLLGVPLFLFQDGGDRSVERAYRELARLTHGAYFRLDSNAAKMLGDLLRAVAAYAAGGRKALVDRAASNRGAQLLLEQLT